MQTRQSLSVPNIFNRQANKLVRHPPRTENSEAYLIRQRKQSLSARAQKKEVSFRPDSFVVCERSTGAVRFRVQADPNGEMPVEHVAGLLAMHCLVRGQAPEDFEVMVVTREPLLQTVAERAEQLLAAGRAIGAGVKISRREQEVLDGVLQSLANKEIASRLNVSERTVKFHVSSLLAKFGVTDRVALSREVVLGRMPTCATAGQTPSPSLFGFPVRVRQGRVENADAPDPSPPEAEVRRSRARLFSLFPRERFAT
jgi:DNA-binding CsgD family transcriptional regulator